MSTSGRKICLEICRFKKMFPWFITSSLRHNTKLWGLYLHFWKFKTNIYRMVACNKNYFRWFSSYNKLKRSRLAVFRSSRERERESRVENRESGNMPRVFVLVPWLKVRRKGLEPLRCVVCYFWMMLQVDGWLNKDPGPLPGPRSRQRGYAIIYMQLFILLMIQPVQHIKLNHHFYLNY